MILSDLFLLLTLTLQLRLLCVCVRTSFLFIITGKLSPPPLWHQTINLIWTSNL